MDHRIKTTIFQSDLKDKTVVITGASSGAGRAIAIEFAKHGAKIVLASRNLEALKDVEANCREMEALAISMQVDVTDAGSMKQLAQKANEFGGSIDVWVNNAGVLAAGEFTDTPIEIHEQVIKTNLLGYINGAHAVMPYFKMQAKGILVNNISIGGYMPVPYSVAYSASKFGLRGYSEALRGELIDYPGIHICDLFPAFLDSPGIQHAANYTGKMLKPAPPVYDPQRIGKEVVKLATKPKNAVFIGGMSPLIQFAHFVAPSLTRNITAKTISKYLQHAEVSPQTSGNLFSTVDFGTSIHGGWNSPGDIELRKKRMLTTAAIAGAATAFALFAKYKYSKSKRKI